MKRLAVIVPGFGLPRVDFKRENLKKNLKTIKKTWNGFVDVIVFNYGSESANNESVKEVFQKGYVGQFIYCMNPVNMKSYDAIMILLDDIELVDVNINILVNNLYYYGLDIVSPSLTSNSKPGWDIMFQKENRGIRISKFLELFCYVMTPNGYEKYHRLLNEKSVWLWGIDLVLHNYGIKTGIVDEMTMHHHIKGEAYKSGPNPYKEADEVFSRLNKTEDPFSIIDIVPLII